VPRYRVEILAAARRTLRRLQPLTRGRLSDAIEELADDPRPHGMKQLVGYAQRTYRIRVSGYRVLYEVHDDEMLIIVVSVAKRDDAYRVREEEAPYRVEAPAEA
jgi:mRNA interferase RelE/StbE